MIDLEGGAQPMIATDDGETLAVLSFSGEIYNFRELRAELSSHGQRFRTRSDTEVILRGYLEWGDALPARLNGMFAFALWDPRARRAILVRDRLGVKPLYWSATRSGRGVKFGSEPKAILANPDFDAVVDTDGLRQLFSRVKVPGAVAWRGMHEVKPGTAVVVDERGVRENCWWEFEARPHEDDLPTTIATIRGLLEDIVAGQLVADVPLSLLLSGGLDSSALTTLAASHHRSLNLSPVRTVTVDFSGQAEAYAASPSGSSGGQTHDAPFAHDVATAVRSDHTNIVLDAGQVMQPSVRSEVVRARDLPIGGLDYDTSLLLLFRAIREHSTVALSGESSDEVFGGYDWFRSPSILEKDTFPWLAGGHAIGGSVWMLDAALVEKLDLKTYRMDAYRSAIGAAPRLSGESGLQAKMREVSYLALTRFVTTLLDRKDRTSMASGLEVRVPFTDHRLVEYLFNTPWSMKTFDGREKSLLRAAVGRLLPDSVRQRSKSQYPTVRDQDYTRGVQAQMQDLAADDSAPIYDLVSIAKVRRAAAIAAEQPRYAALARRGFEQALVLDAWLREYSPTLSIGR